MTSKVRFALGVSMVTAIVSGSVAAREVRLADKGKARCVIVVPPGSMTWEGHDKPADHWGRIAGLTATQVAAEKERRLQRDSVEDLAHYLGRMSSATIEILEGLPGKERRVPIFIGAEAQKVFGPVGISKAGKFGFRVVAGRKGIGLYGESGHGTSYAIYEFLHRLGCRWYMPSDMGECIPSRPRLEVPEMDESLAPATEWRRMEGRTADMDFKRRNRLNEMVAISAQHALEGYITKEQREANPEWCLHVNGKPHPRYLRWTRRDVADAIADNIIQRLDKSYTPSVSLSPGDYVVASDDPEEMKHDPDPRVWEPAANKWSVTDRLILLANRVAERVGKEYPDVLFGLLAYVNYSMPPKNHKVHPNVVPVIAPIDFNRHHPMTWENHPNETWLLDMVQGWGKVASRLGYYAYGMNLAETAAPCPFITKWGTDLPIIMKSKCTYWMPETMGGWDSMMPGFYLSTRLTFYPDEKPDDILKEMWQRFYGAAAEPMEKYWHYIDRCWIDAREYAGGHFGYLKMFPPEKMAQARAYIDEALARCETDIERKRVSLIDNYFAMFELYMRMREDFADARFGGFADNGGWRTSNQIMWLGGFSLAGRRYKGAYAGGSLAVPYFNWFLKKSYDAAARLFRHQRLWLAPAMLKWKYRHDVEKKAEELGWTKPDFDDADWKTTHVVRDTWSSLGCHNTMGRMAYRTTVNLAALPEGKKAFLWIGSTDGSAKLFVNGKHVKYTVPEKTRHHEAGAVIDAFSGYCAPAQFEVTSAIKPGANQITVLCERNWLNELGTGGLMGPVVVFREK